MPITIRKLIIALQDNCNSLEQEVIVANKNNYKFLIDGFGDSIDGELVIDIIGCKKQKIKYK